MYVCVYIYVCVYMYVCVCVCICVQANLIVHSKEQNRRILDITCGGGHRSCAVDSLPEVTVVIHMSFTCHVHTCRCWLWEVLVWSLSSKPRFAMVKWS